MANNARFLVSPRQLLSFVGVAATLYLADPQPVTYWIGCGLGILGLVARVWGCGHLRKNQDVVTSGPYAYVKNPLYVGTFLLALGGLLAAGSPRMPALLLWAVLLPAFLLVWFAYYMPKKIRVEGARLTKHFGEAYAVYNRAVPTFVPGLRRYPEASRQPWRWTTFRDNHELGLDGLLVLVFAAMPLARHWIHGP